MATSAYFAWNADGRPIQPARPVRQEVEALRVAYPRAAARNLFSWYADDAHYQADFPEDHTPYSQTPWPLSPNPYPFVFATDVMHRPDLGVDCQVLFDYWIAEARAGRTPWVKYIIWRGQSYHVQRGWKSKPASGHFDHIHRSYRTDHLHTSIGAWSVVPEGDDMTPAESAEQYVDAYRTFGTQNMLDVVTVPANPSRGLPTGRVEPNLLVQAVKQLQADVAELKDTPPGSTDLTPVLDAIAALSAQVAAVPEDVADEQAERLAG
jgi:hypothetical protein